MMRRSNWWVVAVAVLGACFGGGGGGGVGGSSAGGSDNAAVAQALTEGVKFDGGIVRLQDLPATTKPDVTTTNSSGTVMLKPNTTGMLLALDVDNPDASDPVTAMLLQFGDSDDHIEAPVGSDATIMLPFDVDPGVCDGLCNQTYTLTLTHVPQLESGEVGGYGTIDVTLDCTKDGDPSRCASAPPSDDLGSLTSGELGQRYVEATNDLLGALCSCMGEPPEVCGDVNATLMSAGLDLACLGNAIDASAGSVRTTVECVLSEIGSLSSCLQTATCTDPSTLPCDYDARTASIDTKCGTIPANLQDEFDACFSDTLGGTFTCANGGSVPLSFQCDGEDDCGDNSDEAGCATLTCDGGAIPTSWQCDCFYDCADHSDEAGCDCFVCDNGNIEPPDYACDGFDDCGDNSDEANCL